MRVRQNKTGKPLWIALHAQLKKELEEDPPRHDHLLVSARGRPFSPVYFGAWFAEAIDAAGLPGRCVLHGLRDTGAVLLAHAGVTARE